ncbi:MAG: hypothetical protein WBD74_13435 [Candidatus Aquilonibacter sp.]
MLHAFGSRLMKDYGDWAGFDTPEVISRRKRREGEMRLRADELEASFDIIHGHFIADKYLGLFKGEEFIAFFRDPFQQAVSHYYFIKRNPQREHPETKIFHDANMSLMEYLEWPVFYNQQTQFLGSLDLDDLAFVGICEHYRQSLNLFSQYFGVDLGEERFENVNHQRRTIDYVASRDVRRAIERTRPRDIELYRRACERFAGQIPVSA